MKNQEHKIKVYRRWYFLLVARADRYGIHNERGISWNDKAAAAHKIFTYILYCLN